MKFLFVVPRFHPNLHCAVKALQANGHVVEMVVAHPGGGYGLLQPIEIRTPVRWIDAWRILRRCESDVVVLRNLGRGWLRFHWVAMALGAHVMEYNLRPFDRPYPRKVRLQRRLRFRPLDRLSPVARLAPGTADERSHYVPFPIDTSEGVSDRGYCPEGTTRILCVGKLSQERKQHNLLLDALDGLTARHDFTVTLIGSTGAASGSSEVYFESLRQRERFGPLATRLRIVADVDYALMSDVYRNHDVLVMPAYKERLGICVLEAMAHGCAVVVSDECGSAAYVGPDCGLVFAARNVAHLQESLDRLLGDPGLVSRYGRAAFNRARRDHAPSAYAATMERLVLSSAR